MGTFLASHVCPNCRIKNEEWTVPGSFKVPVKRGGKLPKAFLDATKGEDTIKAKAKCGACGANYEGVVHVNDRAPGGPALSNVQGPK